MTEAQQAARKVYWEVQCELTANRLQAEIDELTADIRNFQSRLGICVIKTDREAEKFIRAINKLTRSLANSIR